MKSLIHEVREFPRFDSRIPESLWQSLNPKPQRLFIQGSPQAYSLLERLPSQGLAIVGTRFPSPRTRHQVREWVTALSHRPLVVISGFAQGVDEVAHESALRVGLPTVAVIASGHRRLYPSFHADLAARILDADGLIVSEHPPDYSPAAIQFLWRNRIIAAWSQAIVIAEAPRRSGALNTARWGRDYGRNCYAVPCYPGDTAFAGNQKLLELEQARAFWGAHDLGSTWLELSDATPQKLRRCAPPTDPDQLALFAQVEKSGSRGSTVQAMLDWALDRNWTPQQFFDAVRGLTKSLHIREDGGALLKNGDISR